jgi:hypothetical protein
VHRGLPSGVHLYGSNDATLPDVGEWGTLEHFHADWKSQSDVRPMKLLAEFELERFQSG